VAGDEFEVLVGDEALGKGGWGEELAAGEVGVDVSGVGEGEVAGEGDV
jgi:hypothetical protein